MEYCTCKQVFGAGGIVGKTLAVNCPICATRQTAGDELALRRVRGKHRVDFDTVPVADESAEFMRGLEVGVVFGVLACTEPEEYTVTARVANLRLLHRMAQTLGYAFSTEVDAESSSALVVFTRRRPAGA